MRPNWTQHAGGTLLVGVSEHLSNKGIATGYRKDYSLQLDKEAKKRIVNRQKLILPEIFSSR